MGVHFGVVAARTSWDRLLAELAGFTGDFLDRGPVADIGELGLGSPDHGWVVLGVEHQGSAFLLDSSMTLWSAGLDRFVEASRRLQCAVGLALGETVSGTFGLFAAERGVVRRTYYNCVSSIRQPFEIGEPFASEAQTPLEEIDGHGLWEALKSYGLDSRPEIGQACSDWVRALTRPPGPSAGRRARASGGRSSTSRPRIG